MNDDDTKIELWMILEWLDDETNACELMTEAGDCQAAVRVLAIGLMMGLIIGRADVPYGQRLADMLLKADNDRRSVGAEALHGVKAEEFWAEMAADLPHTFPL